MTSIISAKSIKETLDNNTSLLFYQSYCNQVHQFVKQVKHSRNFQEEYLEVLIDFLCIVFIQSESRTQKHDLIVLMNNILNIKSQLVVRIISQRKISFRLINYFKQCADQFQLENQLNKTNSPKKNFQIYSIIHLITILLDYQSKNKNTQNRQNTSLFNNNSLISTILSLDMSIITQKQIRHLVSILVILLLKNKSLEKYSVQAKNYILQNISFANDLKSRKNMIEGLKRILILVKIEQKQITKNGIIEWIINHFSEVSSENDTDLLAVVKIILSKFPNFGKKFISAGYLNILKLKFQQNITLITSIFHYLIPNMSDSEKQDLHYFIFNNLHQQQFLFLLLSKLVCSCQFNSILHIIDQGILLKIKKATQTQHVVIAQSIVLYLQNLIKRISQLNLLFVSSMIELIFIGDTLKLLQESNIQQIKTIYNNFRTKYTL